MYTANMGNMFLFLRRNTGKVWGRGMLVARCWILDTGYWILDAGCW
jgi:hypothetical protein